jgi:AcrR family transcriptional regulator
VTRRTPGRRPGGPDTRGEILAAARESFASKGYEGTSIRGIARSAGVDPALVHHYFEGKDSLFVEAMELPIDPRLIAAEVVGGPLDEIGARIIRTFLTAWDLPATQVRMKAMLRSALSSEDVAHMMRETLTRMIFDQIAKVIDRPDARLRISFVASHLIGVALVRYVLELEPLASADRSEIVAHIGPVLQHYLTG